MRRIALAVLLLLIALPAFAGGRGGHNTTFDPNSYGGGWACFRSAASGTCGGATAHFSNAVCDGVTDDSPAVGDWLTYAAALNPILAKLLVPFGSHCHIDPNLGSASFWMNSFDRPFDQNVKNAIVWGYGAFVDNIWIGGVGFPAATVGGIKQQAIIQTVAAGSLTVTTVTPSDASLFPVGRQVGITGLGLQTFGSPPNEQWAEYKIVTANNAGTGLITLDSPLANNYDAGWPQFDLGDASNPDLGGPATIYLMQQTWDTNPTLFGLTITSGAQTNIIGKNIVLQDVTFYGTNPDVTVFAPSTFKNGWFFSVSTPTSEIDKNWESAVFYRYSSSGNLFIQNAGGKLLLSSSSITGLNGTTRDTAVTNSTTTSIRVGPTCCGQANSLSLDGVIVPTAANAYKYTSISAYSFSGGILTIAKASPEYALSASMWVPGHKYFAGDNDGSNTCSPANTFTATGVQDAGSSVNISTDLSSVTFGNTCGLGTRPPTKFGSYNVMNLTQKFSGPANLLSLPEMLPP